jgi:hypothetical protein
VTVFRGAAGAAGLLLCAVKGGALSFICSSSACFSWAAVFFPLPPLSVSMLF